MNKKTSDIHKQAVEKQKKESEELTEKLIDENKKKILAIEVQENEAMQNELTDANVAYAKQFAANINSEEARKGITRAYQMDRLRIIREYNQKIFEREVEFLKKSIQNTKLSADAKLDIEREITKLTNENAKDAADYEVEVTEDKIENMENLEDEYNRFMSDKRTKAVMNIWEQALDIANMYYEEQIKMIDAAEKKEKESYDAKLSNLQENLDAGLISEEKAAARKKILEEEQMQKEKQFEAQRKAMQKKQAVWQKANAIIQATINTAQAVTAAYGIPGVGIALASIIAALGAVQIGMIASQKIPEYEKGTKGHTGGPAIVGDGGRAEMVIFPSGKIWKTPAKDTLVNLPRGTEILPDFKKAFENIAAQPVTLYRTDEGMGETLVLYDDVQRNLLKNNNEKLSAIQHSLRSLDVIRQNTAYSNNRKYIDNWMKNY
jgi:hypothetical protein